MFGEIAAVVVNDDVVGTALLVEPAGECDDAALGSAELIDLGHDDWPGAGGDGLHGPLRRCLASLSSGLMLRTGLALAESVEVGEELGEADGCGFSSLDFGVACGAKRGDGEGHGDAVVGA